MSAPDVIEINEAYFNACNFETLMRGIHFAVLCMALSKIFTGPQRSGQSRQAMTLLILVLFVLSTIHNATYWAYVRRAFIAHGETAQSTADALNEYPDWFTGITSVSDANAILADCVIIWRCWVVWGRQWWITVVPIICTMLTTAFSIIAIYQTVTSTTFGAVGVDYATALYSTSLATTLYCTAVIVYRVVQVGRVSRVGERSGAGIRAYRGVIEILVESSALYCIATLFALVAYIRSGPASEFASAFWTSITGIAPTLIVGRVASGEARPDDSWMDSKDSPGTLSFLRFRSGAERTTTTHSYELDMADSSLPMTMTRATGYTDDTVASRDPSERKKLAPEENV